MLPIPGLRTPGVCPCPSAAHQCLPKPTSVLPQAPASMGTLQNSAINRATFSRRTTPHSTLHSTAPSHGTGVPAAPIASRCSRSVPFRRRHQGHLVNILGSRKPSRRATGHGGRVSQSVSGTRVSLARPRMGRWSSSLCICSVGLAREGRLDGESL
jgi:hypothetical protein